MVTVVFTHVQLLIALEITWMSALDFMMKALAVSNSYKWTNASIITTLGSPSISGLISYSSSTSTSITFVINTRNAPPSSIKWYRDDTLVDINRNSTNMSVRVTSRSRSYFETSLTVCDSPDNIIGTYTCEVSNRRGRDTESYTVRGKRILSYSHRTPW